MKFIKTVLLVLFAVVAIGCSSDDPIVCPVDPTPPTDSVFFGDADGAQFFIEDHILLINGPDVRIIFMGVNNVIPVKFEVGTTFLVEIQYEVEFDDGSTLSDAFKAGVIYLIDRERYYIYENYFSI